MSSVLDQPLRTRERAALDTARSAFRKLAQEWSVLDANDVREAAEDALERIALILGERS